MIEAFFGLVIAIGCLVIVLRGWWLRCVHGGKRKSYRIKMQGEAEFMASGMVGAIDWERLESWVEVWE